MPGDAGTAKEETGVDETQEVVSEEEATTEEVVSEEEVAAEEVVAETEEEITEEEKIDIEAEFKHCSKAKNSPKSSKIKHAPSLKQQLKPKLLK